MLADLPSAQLFQVEYCGHGHIRWEAADIDLHTGILTDPEDSPLNMHGSASAAAARMGKAGGAVRSARKSAASRANGAKGGRPKKKTEPAPA